METCVGNEGSGGVACWCSINKGSGSEWNLLCFFFFYFCFFCAFLQFFFNLNAAAARG